LIRTCLTYANNRGARCLNTTAEMQTKSIATKNTMNKINTMNTINTINTIDTINIFKTAVISDY
jgi:hypothetical protein